MANDVFMSCYEDPQIGDGVGVGDGVADGSQAKTRNRPSNSSRHRGEVVTDLGPEEVRWFYKEDKRTWKPFVGHDSLKIETVYRRLWELNPDKVRQRQRRRTGTRLVETQAETQPEPEPEPEPEPAAAAAAAEVRPRGSVSDLEVVCVRGGLYEVHVKDKESYPVYWNQQERIPVMRGQWFIGGTWLPLEEDESDGIELEHLVRFRGQRMRDTYELEEAAAATATAAAAAAAAAVETKDGEEEEEEEEEEEGVVMVGSLKLSRSHVDWHSVDEVYLYSDATTSKIARTVTQRLGFSKASRSSRLHRGYVEEAAPEDTPPETTHIVFVVHGIGQKMDQGRIIRNTSMMRDAARKMEEKHFSNRTTEHVEFLPVEWRMRDAARKMEEKHFSNRTTEHVEFLPVEWRSKLALDGDTVDSITPDKVRGLRDMLNSSAMDIMYYTSPLYRDEVRTSTFFSPTSTSISTTLYGRQHGVFNPTLIAVDVGVVPFLTARLWILWIIITKEFCAKLSWTSISMCLQDMKAIPQYNHIGNSLLYDMSSKAFLKHSIPLPKLSDIPRLPIPGLGGASPRHTTTTSTTTSTTTTKEP
ncbi:hypothetical protein CRUP_027958 [Coryphaenoides rupestris]|nr:hypothetical protein CRUP_027958 [Coryphaenoides rupestris]